MAIRKFRLGSGGTVGNFLVITSAMGEAGETSQPQINQTLGGVAGGGASATLGKVADTGGPATAGQNGWIKMKDSAGADIWIPVWK